MLMPVSELSWKVVIDRSSLLKWFLISFFLGTAFTLCVTKSLEQLSTALAVMVCALIAVGVYLFFTAIEKLILKCVGYDKPADASGEGGIEAVLLQDHADKPSREVLSEMNKVVDKLKRLISDVTPKPAEMVTPVGAPVAAAIVGTSGKLMDAGNQKKKKKQNKPLPSLPIPSL